MCMSYVAYFTNSTLLDLVLVFSFIHSFFLFFKTLINLLSLVLNLQSFCLSVLDMSEQANIILLQSVK